MKKFLSLCCFCLLVALSVPALAAPTLHLKGNTVVMENNGKKTDLPGDTFVPQDVQGADLRFVAISPDNKDSFSIEPGLYLFDKAGKTVAFIPSEDAEMCSEVRFSPKGDILAMDVGASLVRSWFFFSYPALKPMGEVSYYLASENPALIWNGDAGVLFSAMNAEVQGRVCGYDPCVAVSVEYHDFSNGKTEVLMAGTPECNYTLADFDPAKELVSIEKLCLASGAAWEQFPEDVPTQTVTVPLKTR
ncbi:MAG: hypothetical protein PHI96_06280 [Desulfovibrio sp.]|nr:hypothetical protein [Desulfovibrio sp.]